MYMQEIAISACSTYTCIEVSLENKTFLNYARIIDKWQKLILLAKYILIKLNIN